MKIKYYYSVASPFSYLAIDRLIDLINENKLEVEEKPFDLVGEVFPNTGGIPVPKRHSSRLKYRLKEIKRIGEKLKLYGLKYSKHEKKLIIENLYLNNHLKTFMIVLKKT